MQISPTELSSMKLTYTNKIEVVSIKDIAMLVKTCFNNKTFVLGEGTNTYFSDNLSGIKIIKLNLKQVSIKGNLVTAEAGVNWDKLVQITVKNNLWGLENLSFIPGSVGASPVQNIGAYGVEVKDLIVSVKVFNTKTKKIEILKNKDCMFGYRDSIFKKKKFLIILSVTFKLSRKAKRILTYTPLNKLPQDSSLERIRKEVIKTRKSKLPNPKKVPNCGSFFKNPIVSKTTRDYLLNKYPDIPVFTSGKNYKVSAAYLIDKVANLKGYKYKNLQTFPLQALVITNIETSSFSDISEFVKFIQDTVFEKTSINLIPEVNVIGI